MAGSPAWHRRPQCPGYGHWVSYVWRLCLGLVFAVTPPILAGVLGGCAWVRVSAAPRHSWLGCWGVCVFVCVPCLYPATPGWDVRFGCVRFGSGFGCAPPLLAGVLGCVCVLVCTLGLQFWLCPATPGWGVGVCVCLCACSVFTPPLLAGLCRVGVCLGSGFGCAPPIVAGVLGCVCACVRAPLVTRHSWRGCTVWVCVFELSLSCAPPLLAGVFGCVCVCVHAPPVPCHSWLGCAVWVCAIGLWFRLRPAHPGLGVVVCVCLCAYSACTPPLLAGVCRVGLCAWARVSAAPCHSWLGCWGVCLFVCVLRLYPATPGLGVRCGCACLGSGFGCAPPLLAWMFGFACVLVCVLRLYPATPGWAAVGVCELGLGFLLRPAPPGWGVGVCVCLCACSACTLPLLAGVCGMGVSLNSAVGYAPPPLAGVLGCVCVCVRVPRVARHSWLGSVVCVCVCLGLGFGCAPPLLARMGVCVSVRARLVAPHSRCVGSVSPGTCSCAVVHCGLCALPGFAAPGDRCCLSPVLVPWLWPAACRSGVPGGPALVRPASSRPVAISAPVGSPDAVVPFPNPKACAPRFTGRLRGACGGLPRTGLSVPAPGRCRDSSGGLARRRARSGPRDRVCPGRSLRRRSWATCAAVVCVCGPGH